MSAVGQALCWAHMIYSTHRVVTVIHSFSEYLWRAFWMSGTILVARGTTMNQVDKNLKILAFMVVEVDNM